VFKTYSVYRFYKFLDPQQTTAGTSTPIGINLHHPQQQQSSQPSTPPLITGKDYILT